MVSIIRQTLDNQNSSSSLYTLVTTCCAEKEGRIGIGAAVCRTDKEVSDTICTSTYLDTRSEQNPYTAELEAILLAVLESRADGLGKPASGASTTRSNV